MKNLKVEIPLKKLINVLSSLPEAEFNYIIKKVKHNKELKKPIRIKIVRVAPTTLDGLTDIISVGGDALKETEKIYE